MRLVLLTGRSPSWLIRAMSPLGTIGDRIRRLPLSAIEKVTEEVTEPRRRPACRLCMVRRHILGVRLAFDGETTRP